MMTAYVLVLPTTLCARNCFVYMMPLLVVVQSVNRVLGHEDGTRAKAHKVSK